MGLLSHPLAVTLVAGLLGELAYIKYFLTPNSI